VLLENVNFSTDAETSAIMRIKSEIERQIQTISDENNSTDDSLRKGNSTDNSLKKGNSTIPLLLSSTRTIKSEIGFWIRQQVQYTAEQEPLYVLCPWSLEEANLSVELGMLFLKRMWVQ
jgi:hypothetical protein